MAIGTAAAIGAGMMGIGAIGTAAGWGKEEAEVKPTTKLSKEQLALISPLSQFLQKRLQTGAPKYGAEMVAGMTPMQQQALQAMSKYMTAGAPMGKEMEASMTQYLKGSSPEEMQKWYETYVLPSEERYFKETTLPGIRESYIGPTGEGGFWGTQRAGAEALGYERFGEQVTRGVGGAIARGRGEALTAMGMVPAMGRYLAEPMQMGWQMGEATRQIETQRLLADYQEFIRTSPGSAETINQILAFLGIPMMENIMMPGTESPFAGLLQAGAGVVGATT